MRLPDTPLTSPPSRVAIIGATGYIGGRLVRRLLDAGYAVRCLVRSPGKLADRAWADRVEIHQAELGNVGVINRSANQLSRTLPVLLEINVAGEASKYGFVPERMLDELKELNDFPRLEIHGLMAIPPWGPNPEKARPMFQFLRELRTRAEQKLGAPLPHLSMGMSSDFEIAIEEGATMVRVGTALFGTNGRRNSDLAP